MAKDNPAAFFEALRRSSAKQLKLDPDNLSAAEATRVDRVCALRVCVDHMTSQQLATGEFDARSYIAASQELEKLLGGDPERPTHVFATNESQLKLRALIEKRLQDNIDAAAPSDVAADEAADLPRSVAEEALTPNVAPVAELLPEGTEPPSNPRVTYIDNAVVEHETADERYARVNGGTVTPAQQHQPSPTTSAYLGGGNDLGGNPWVTKNWSPPKGF